MPFALPTLPLPAGITAPAGFPHFIGYRGTSKTKARFLCDYGVVRGLLSRPELGEGLYFTHDPAAAALYADRIDPQVVHVFCDDLLMAHHGDWCNPALYVAPGAGMAAIPNIPGHLLTTLSFLRDFNTPEQFKINVYGQSVMYFIWVLLNRIRGCASGAPQRVYALAPARGSSRI